MQITLFFAFKKITALSLVAGISATVEFFLYTKEDMIESNSVTFKNFS